MTIINIKYLPIYRQRQICIRLKKQDIISLIIIMFISSICDNKWFSVSEIYVFINTTTIIIFQAIIVYN